MFKVRNNAPNNLKVINIAPTNKRVLNSSPTNQKIVNQNFTYMETRTIKQGQPIPWGLNWLLTYPTTFSFQGVRF